LHAGVRVCVHGCACVRTHVLSGLGVGVRPECVWVCVEQRDTGDHACQPIHTQEKRRMEDVPAAP
jgi:hypothetical protein